MATFAEDNLTLPFDSSQFEFAVRFSKEGFTFFVRPVAALPEPANDHEPDPAPTPPDVPAKRWGNLARVARRNVAASLRFGLYAAREIERRKKEADQGGLKYDRNAVLAELADQSDITVFDLETQVRIARKERHRCRLMAVRRWDLAGLSNNEIAARARCTPQHAGRLVREAWKNLGEN